MNKCKIAGFGLFMGLVILYSCHPSAYRSTNTIYRKQARSYARELRHFPLRDSAQQSPFFAGTTNFTLRKPNFVVIHHTAQSTCDSTLRTFTLPATKVSAHYVICRNGTVFHMLNDYLRAHHAGVSRWGNTLDLNSSSIGIEIDNNGFEPFTEEQMSSLLQLLGRLKNAYAIPQANFIGHADVAPGRKVDPSRYFSWQRLAENGFGHWYDTTQTMVPADFNPIQALRIIGYAIKDTGIAIQSYKIHFLPQDTSRVIGAGDRKILYELMKKYE
ncbi:MAG: hypothetical protein RL732_1279 [Bacteroidota bacterium]